MGGRYWERGGCRQSSNEVQGLTTGLSLRAAPFRSISWPFFFKYMIQRDSRKLQAQDWLGLGSVKVLGEVSLSALNVHGEQSSGLIPTSALTIAL